MEFTSSLNKISVPIVVMVRKGRTPLAFPFSLSPLSVRSAAR